MFRSGSTSTPEAPALILSCRNIPRMTRPVMGASWGQSPAPRPNPQVTRQVWPPGRIVQVAIAPDFAIIAEARVVVILSSPSPTYFDDSAIERLSWIGSMTMSGRNLACQPFADLVPGFVDFLAGHLGDVAMKARWSPSISSRSVSPLPAISRRSPPKPLASSR